MQLSAEARWFWQGASQFKDWFLDPGNHADHDAGPDKDGERRTDEYVVNGVTSELGAKRRDGSKTKLEIKGMVARHGGLDCPPFSGIVELWCKWPCDELVHDSAKVVPVEKQRWLRKFDLSSSPKEVSSKARPERGCNVEMTSVTLDGVAWWSFAFEAFGGLLDLADNLRAVAALMASRNPPDFPPGAVEVSYPGWLVIHRRAGAL